MTETLDHDSTPALPSGAPRPRRWQLAAAAVAIAVVAGAAGAGLTQLMFPAGDGRPGPAGRPGETGPAGPAGPAGVSGTTASLDTNKVGYCFDVTYQYQGDMGWVDYVSLTAPTSTNGTLSCPSGSFVSLTPTGPNGWPVKNYDAPK